MDENFERRLPPVRPLQNKHLHGARRRDADSFRLICCWISDISIDAMPGLVWTALRGWSDRILQPELARLHGLDDGASISKSPGWIEAIHPDIDHERVGETWRSRVISGISAAMEARIRRHDGAYRWFVCHAHPARDAEGDISRWIGTNVDCEDHAREHEEALHSN